MKKVFYPTPDAVATHMRISDGMTGILQTFEDDAVIHSPVPLVFTDDEFEKIKSAEDPAPQEEPPPEPIALPTSFSVSKLAVRRKLREAGLENVLDGLLASNPMAAADWNDAVEISTEDPLFQAFLPIFAQHAEMDDGSVLEMLRP